MPKSLDTVDEKLKKFLTSVVGQEYIPALDTALHHMVVAIGYQESGLPRHLLTLP